MLRLRPLLAFGIISSRKGVDSDAEGSSRAKLVHNRVRRFCLQHGIPGMSVVVVTQSGRHVFNYGYGNIETLTAFNERTMARVASVSKCLASVVIAGLMDEYPDLVWDRTVGQCVSGLPAGVSSITLRQLASHTSGIRHYRRPSAEDPSVEDEFLSDRHFKDLGEAVQCFVNDPVLAVDGKFSYTTHGYTLLTYAVEGFVKKRIGQQMSLRVLYRRMFEELGMTDSCLEMDYRSLVDGSRCEQYLFESNGEFVVLRRSAVVDNSHKFGGGGVLSSSMDLSRFGEALLLVWNGGGLVGPGKLLSRRSLGALWRPEVDLCRYRQFYGLGWMIDRTRHESDVFYHTGHAVGGMSMLAVCPDRSVVLAIVSNSDNGRHLLKQFAFRILAEFGW